MKDTEHHFFYPDTHMKENKSPSSPVVYLTCNGLLKRSRHFFRSREN